MTTAGDLLGYNGLQPSRFIGGSNGNSLHYNTTVSSGFNLQWAPEVVPMVNMGFKTSVAANALTITFTQADGSSSPNNSSFIRYRSATLTSGQVQSQLVTSSDTIAITIPSGATIGTTNSYSGYIYVFSSNGGGINNNICISLNPFACDGFINATAINSSSSSATTMYSNTSLTSVVCTYIGKLLAPQATAGTWITTPTELYVGLSDYAAQWHPVSTDGVTVLGSGLPSSLISLATVGTSGNYYGHGFTANNYGQISAQLNIGSAFMVQYRQTQTISSGSITTILGNNLVASTTFRTQTNPTISSWVASTGVYTCGQDGVYMIGGWVNFAASTGGTQRVLWVAKTDALQTDSEQAVNSITYLNASGGSQCNVCMPIYCKTSDQLFIQCFQDSGTTMTNLVFQVCINLLSVAI